MALASCSRCNKTFKDIATLNVHLKISHQGCYKYVCKVGNCTRTYGSWNPYTKHLVSVHNVPRRADENVAQPSVLLDTSNDTNMEVESVPTEACDSRTEPDHVQPPDLTQLLVKQQDILVAKLYANPAFPRNLVDKIVKDFSNYMSSPFFDSLKDLVLSSLPSNSPADKRQEIGSKFEVLMNPFQHLATEHKRVAYFEQSGDYIEPQTYKIATREERARSKKTGLTLKMKTVKGQKIQLKRVLKKNFELPHALSDTLLYMNSLQENSDWVCNFTQCTVWQRKLAKFDSNDIVMPLYFYYDECEANNPLGPHSEPMGCSYVHVPCLPTDWSSKLENIFLALLFDADNRSVYGNYKVFKPVIKELTDLETNGVDIETVELGLVKVFFVLGAILGDKKALNGVCGFTEGFNADHYCRTCKCHRDRAYNLFVEDPTLLRTPENYMEDVLANNPKSTGIKEKCVFMKVPSFEAPTDICVDEFHDVIEGVAHYTMLPVLNHFHKMHPHFLSTLNHRLYCIDLGVDSDNRPPLISVERLSKDKFKKMTGAEMYLFVRIFGVLVKDMIPEDDQYYQLYLYLHDIVSLTHAKGLPRDSAGLLKSSVERHHELYVKLTKQTLKPKHHFLLHYALLFLLFGPFGLLSTIRFEAKHRLLKLTALTCMSRTNLSKTVAIKQQLALLFRSVALSSPRSEMIYGPVSLVDARDLHYYEAFSLSLPDVVFNDPSNQKITNWVEYKGTKYQPKQVLLTGTDEVGLFSFAEIQFIFVLEDRPLFVCSPFDTLGYFSEVRGYEVQRLPQQLNWFAIEQGKLLDPNPLCLYTMASGENVVVLKYVI